MATTGLGTIVKEEPKNTLGWNEGAKGFFSNLGDVLTLDMFDLNQDNPTYKFTPSTSGVQTPDYSKSFGLFKNASVSPTIGALKTAAMNNPDAFGAWYGQLGDADKTSINDIMARQGWNLGDIGMSENSPILDSYSKLADSQVNMANLATQQYADRMNSPWFQNRDMIQGLGNIVGAAGSLAGIYTGLKQLDLMKDQIGIAKDQWAEAKNELSRVRKVRDNLNTSYMA